MVAFQAYQRDTAFALFVLVVVGACFLFVLEKLRALLIPLVWAFFFAIPFLAVVVIVENRVVILSSVLAVRLCGCQRRTRVRVPFQHTAGQNCIYLDRHDVSSAEAADALLDEVHSRCSRRNTRGLLSRIFTRMDRSFLSCLWGQRVRIVRMSVPPRVQAENMEREEDCDEVMVGGLVAGRSYYVSSDRQVSGDVEDTRVGIRLFIDRQEIYPAVLAIDDGGQVTQTFEGDLEVDPRSTLSWFISMVSTMCLVCIMATFFIKMLWIGVEGVQSHFGDYQKGFTELIHDFKDLTSHLIPGKDWDDIEKQVTDTLTAYGKTFAEGSLEYLEGFAGQLFLFLVYVLFWLFEPLPVTEPIAKVFKQYLALKTIVCALFAGIMAVCLQCLSCPIWPLYFFVTFLLNYIPEVGPLLAGVLMLPAVLLDGALSKRTRYAHATILVIVGTVAKIVTGNIIEVELYSRYGGEFMRIHPVVLFVFFTFCGYQLGTTGMFISIPILAAIKYALVSQAMPGRYLNAVLTIIEGDVWAPHRNRAERQKARTDAFTELGGPTPEAELAPTGTDGPREVQDREASSRQRRAHT